MTQICKIIGRRNYSITKVLHQIPVNSPYQTQNIPDIIIEEFKPSPNFSSDLKQSVSIAKRIIQEIDKFLHSKTTSPVSNLQTPFLKIQNTFDITLQRETTPLHCTLSGRCIGRTRHEILDGSLGGPDRARTAVNGTCHGWLIRNRWFAKPGASFPF